MMLVQPRQRKIETEIHSKETSRWNSTQMFLKSSGDMEENFYNEHIPGIVGKNKRSIPNLSFLLYHPKRSAEEE